MTRRKSIVLGKIRYSTPKRRTNEISLEIEYKDGERPAFSASGNLWNTNHTDILMGGQCLEELYNLVCLSNLPAEKIELFKTIYGLWERNHLNDMVAYANETQRLGVEEYMKLHNSYDYDGVCDFLKEKGIYEVVVDGKVCAYGNEWYYKPIKDADLKMIKDLFEDQGGLENEIIIFGKL